MGARFVMANSDRFLYYVFSGVRPWGIVLADGFGRFRAAPFVLVIFIGG